MFDRTLQHSNVHSLTEGQNPTTSKIPRSVSNKLPSQHQNKEETLEETNEKNTSNTSPKTSLKQPTSSTEQSQQMIQIDEL